MAYRPGILEACQDWGLRLGFNGPMGLLPYAGWETRGNPEFNPKGSVNHHTAGAPRGLLPSLPTLLNGRPGLSGPLCNSALARNACIHLIAAGRANHAGLGGWKGIVGNSNVWGLEVEHIGTVLEPITEHQWHAMYLWHRACADYSGFHPAYVCQHFEWAPTRKIDFVKPITDPALFRANVLRQEKNDMPLNDTDKTWLRKLSYDRRDEVIAALRDHVDASVEDSVRANIARLGQYVAGGKGNQVFNPQIQEWMADAVTLPDLAAMVVTTHPGPEEPGSPETPIPNT